VLVLGGTGFVGQALCEALVERSGGAGMRIVVPTRQISRGKNVQFLPTVEIIEASIHDDAQLARLLTGRDAVVNLVAILNGSAADFERVHVELPRRLAAAMKVTGVRRLVHVSALGVGPDVPSNYLRTKTAGEQVLSEAALDLTLLRPSVIFGAKDRFLNVFALLQSVLPVFPLAGAQARFQPVWVMDVARAIASCLADDSTIGRTYECAGPREYTLAELVRLAGRCSGHERPVLALPDAVARLQAAVMELAPGQPLMSRDNLDSMRVPNIATGKLPGLADLGIEPTPLEAIAPTFLGPARGCARFNVFRAHARR
jgi:NADH dehydrogenase